MGTFFRQWASRWAAGALVGIGIATILAGLTARVGPYVREPTDFWSALAVAGTGGDKYDSLEALVAAGDLVVVGSVRSVGMGRTFGVPSANSEHPHEALSYSAALELEVEEVLGGRHASRAAATLNLEALLVDPARLDYVRSVFMPHRGIFVLLNEGLAARAQGLPEAVVSEHLPYWRLVNDQGLLVFNDGLAEGHPLAQGSFIDWLEGTSFDDVLERVRILAR